MEVAARPREAARRGRAAPPRSRAELGRDALERRKRTLGERRERGGSLALVRRDRSSGRARRLRELLGVPEALTSRQQLLLVAGLHSLGCGDERLQLGETRRDRIGVARELLVPAPRDATSSRQASRASRRRSACSTPQNASSTSSWNDARASRRCSNWPDIAMSRSAAVATSSRATARPHAYARVRPSPKTRRAIDEPRLVLRPQLGERSELLVVEEAVGHVELGLDVRLRPLGADGRGIRAGPEQEPDRLREDRLARAGLARDRVQPGRERRAPPRG